MVNKKYLIKYNEVCEKLKNSLFKYESIISLSKVYY